MKPLVTLFDVPFDCCEQTIMFENWEYVLKVCDGRITVVAREKMERLFPSEPDYGAITVSEHTSGNRMPPDLPLWRPAGVDP